MAALNDEAAADFQVLDLTLSLDTSAYVDGDVLADTQSIAQGFKIQEGRAVLQSILVLDEDDQGQPFDLIFLDSNVSLGTENAAVSITDANARKIIGRVQIGSGDYYDMGGSRIAAVGNIGQVLKAAATSRALYVGAVSRGTGTYTASGIKLKIGVIWD